MKKSIFFILIVSIALGGCSNKKTLSSTYEHAIASTQKVKISLADKSNLLITATYLNNLKPYSNADKDMIVFSVYYSDKSEKGTPLSKLNISLNDKIVQAIELNIDDEMVTFLPSKSSWSKYFLVTAPMEEEKIVTLLIKISPFSQALLVLQKDF